MLDFILYIYEIHLRFESNQVQAILPQGTFVYNMLSGLNGLYPSLKSDYSFSVFCGIHSHLSSSLQTHGDVVRIGPCE